MEVLADFVDELDGIAERNRNVIGKDESFTLKSIPCDSYDVKLVDEDGDECVVDDVDICGGAESWTITNTKNDGKFTSCSGPYPSGGWPICQYCSQQFACGSSADDPFAPNYCCWTGTRAIVCMGEK